MENYSSISSQFVTYKIALKLKELGFAPIMAAAFQTQEENRLIVHWYNKRDFEIAPHLLPAPLWQQVWSFLDDNEVIIGIIFVDNVFKYTLNTNNYVSNGFTNRMSAIKSATEHATNYLWNKKFNK